MTYNLTAEHMTDNFQKVFCHGCEANGSTAETKEKAIMRWRKKGL